MADEEVVSRGMAVATAMTGNPNFPTPPVNLTILKSDIENLSALIAESLDGSKKVIAQKNKQREGVIEMLRLLGRYVEVTSKNDLATFQSSGFQAAPTPQASTPQPLPTPTITKVDHGSVTGQLLVRIKGHKKARSYDLRYGAMTNGNPPATWTTLTIATVKAAYPINGLTPGTIYAVQARAFRQAQSHGLDRLGDLHVHVAD
jgi:hypothetical protein